MYNYNKRSWSSWPLVLWVPFTLQIGPVCDTNLFPSILVGIVHSITFINELLACPLSKFQILTGAVIWTLVIVQCFECAILVAEWLASASAMAAPSEVKQRTELDVVLFHGLQLTAKDSSDAWSSTWTQRGHDDVCWPQKWLPFDLVEAVRIFSVSYNAHVVNSPYDHVSEIADNLFQTLINPRYKSPLFDYQNSMLGQM